MREREDGLIAGGDGYRELYLQTPVMMHSIDSTGRLLEVSDFWLEVLGYEREEVLGTKLTLYLSENSRRLAEDTFLPQFFRVGFVKDVPYQMVKKNGEVIDVLVSAVSERDRLGNIRRSMAGILDVTERKKTEEEIYRLAHYDQLTGQPNRFLLRDRLHQALAQGIRDGEEVAVFFLDLDRFKWVNDTLGHAAGDALLQVVARRLTECVRAIDTVARIGGDEFVVILYGILSSDDLAVFASRILESLSRPTCLEGKEFIASASIGIAICPVDGEDEDTLLRNADTAMYAAKEVGGNSYQFFSTEMAARAQAKLGIESSLRRAFNHQEFFLVYQPQFDLRTRKISGFEALLRWAHPTEGTIGPSRFIPVAEETGLIIPLGAWVLQTACRQAMAWRKAGFPRMRMAVNISARQFARPDFIDLVEGVLKETGLEPELLEIELTETTVMESIEEAITTLTDLKIRKVNLAIDDFGTGYSSLIYLKHFPFDRIKIAQEFVRNIPGDPEDRAIVEAILVMGRSLKLAVIAEGVEKKEQLDFLTKRHCHEMQGYYFGRPACAGEIPGRIISGGLH
ncbi:putative diguanylate cyclase [Desulfuromonas soudanensis]|uniref:Putative diguanylate cyclase n=1 Tax=Desulfuromonas soudanensis TaxID=1603606 RepID=A0A0M3QEW7_9BACT|nr:EAL domain-containing protein [Desulfuromonas soudanensis]ALC15033.1 putative diguanylate cyclase [Desulfuromonas soudanensis]